MRNAIRRAPRRGAALVELALLMPLVLTLLLGIWEVGRMIEVQQAVSTAAREGGRQAATGTRTASQVQQAVLNTLTNCGLNSSGTVVTVSNLTASGTDPSNAAQLDRLRVNVSVPFANVRWIALDWFIAPGSNIASTSDWYSMKDIPITVLPTMPVE